MDPTARPPGSAREEALLQQVIGLVEPLTRFDRSSFAGISFSAEQARARAVQRATVSFRVEESAGTGRLPVEVTDLRDAAGVRAHLDTAVSRERRALPGRLRQWLANETGVPRRGLAASHCMQEQARVGFAWACSACAATGEVACPRCGGNRQVTCPTCQGTGQQDCGQCWGKGRTLCLACGGRGTWQEQRNRQRYVPNAQGISELVTEFYTETLRCGACGGAGSKDCFSCGASGRQRCAGCLTTGRIACPGCGATGRVACQTCAATGWRHEVARLSCEVTPAFAVSASSSRDEVRTTLERLGRIEDLSALAPLAPSRAESGDAHVECEYEATVPVTAVSLSAAGIPLEIVGYGDPPRVFDFKNIVGALLQADLSALESAVQSTSKFALRPSTRLTEGLSGLLRSEANARIAAAIGGRSATPGRLVSDGLRGAVSEDYATRASAAIREAIARIFWSGTATSVVAFLVAPALVYSFLWLVCGVGACEPPSALVLVSPIAIAVLEWRARRRVRASVGPSLGNASIDGLKSAGTLVRWRLLLAASALVGIVGGWIGVAYLLQVTQLG